MKDQLKNYSEEIGLRSPFTLETLIESHKRLRAMAVEKNAKELSDFHALREAAAQKMAKEATDNGWFSKERLKSMTLSEISEIICDGDC